MNGTVTVDQMNAFLLNKSKTVNFFLKKKSHWPQTFERFENNAASEAKLKIKPLLTVKENFFDRAYNLHFNTIIS